MINFLHHLYKKRSIWERMSVNMYVKFCDAYGKEFPVPAKDRSYIFGRKVINDIGYIEVEKIEECNRLIRDEQSWKIIPELVAVIYGVENDKVKAARICDVYPVAVQIVNELERLQKMKESASAFDLKNEEVQAGAEDFAKYGIYMTIRSVAGRLNLKHAEVWKMPYYDFLLEVRVSRDEAVYNEKLSKIYANKYKRK